MAESTRETSALLRIIDELHDGTEDGGKGLVELGRLIEVVARKPRVRDGDKLSIAVVGNGDLAGTFIEDYLGATLKNKGLGTENKAVVVRTGLQGEHNDSLQAAVDGLNFCLHEAVEADKMDAQLISFIRMPSVVGKSQFEEDRVAQVVRETIEDPKSSKSIRSIFEDMDTNSDRYLSREEFVEGLEALSTRVSRREVEQLFDMIDVNKESMMEFDEFLHAMKPPDLPYSYDVEDFFMKIAQAVDFVVVLVDPRITRINRRELLLYERLYETHKSKLFFGCFLQERHLSDQHTPKYIQSTRDKMSACLHDVKFKKLPVVWTSKSQHALDAPNSLQDIHDVIALRVDKILEATLVAPSQLNLVNVCSKMFDVKNTELNNSLVSLVDRLVLSSHREPGDFQPLLKLNKVATTVQSAINKVASMPDGPSSSMMSILHGMHLFEERSEGDEGEMLPNLPAGWEARKEEGREVFFNPRLHVSQPTRPTEARRSLKLFLHAIDNLYEDPRNPSSISNLSRELGEEITKPLLQHKVFVLLLGNGEGPADFLHWYTGSKLKNVGLGTTHHFTVIARGDKSSVVKGQAAVDQLKLPEVAKMMSMQGMERAIAFEELPCYQTDDGDLDALVFIRAPAIEGRDSKLDPATQAAFDKLREDMAHSRKTLREEFDALCSSTEDPKHARMSLFDFSRGVQDKHLELSQQEINSIFADIDTTGQGEVGWEEFSSAFRQADSNQPVSNLDEALSKIADMCGLVIILGDPTRVSYNTKEMSVYTKMLETYKDKCKFYCALPVGHVTEDDLERHVNKMQGAFNKHCRPLAHATMQFFYKDKYALDRLAGEFVSAGDLIKMDICHVVDRPLHSMLKSVDLHLAKLFEKLMERESPAQEHLKFTLLNMAADLSDLNDLPSFSLRKILRKYGKRAAAPPQPQPEQQAQPQTQPQTLAGGGSKQAPANSGKAAETIEKPPASTIRAEEAKGAEKSAKEETNPPKATPPQATNVPSKTSQVTSQPLPQPPAAANATERSGIEEEEARGDVAPTGRLLGFIANVHEDSRVGLKLIASSLRLEQEISTPRPSRKVNVMLVGDRGGKLAFIEQYTESQCKSRRHRANHFLVVQSGCSRDVDQGQGALSTLLQGFGGNVDKLSRLRDIKAAFMAEQIEQDVREFVLVNFIVAPDLVGHVRRPDASVSEVFADISRQIGQHKEEVLASLRRRDDEGHGVLTVKDVRSVMEDMKLGCESSKLHELFHHLNLKDEDRVDYSACLESLLHQDDAMAQERERAIETIGEECDVIIFLLHPTRSTTSPRELEMCKLLFSKHRHKLHLMCFLEEKSQRIARVGSLVQNLGSLLSRRCEDESLCNLDSCFVERDPPLCFDGVIANHMPGLFKIVGDASRPILDPVLQRARDNLDQVHSAVLSSGDDKVQALFDEMVTSYAKKSLRLSGVFAGRLREIDDARSKHERVESSTTWQHSNEMAFADVKGRQTDRWNTTTHILIWLETLGLQRYMTAFQQANINSSALLFQLSADDLADLGVEESSRETLMAEIGRLKDRSEERPTERFRIPLWRLLHEKLITPQELQMMYGVLEGNIKIPEHKRVALETGLSYFMEGTVSADTAAELCKDIRRQAAKMLGLREEEVKRPEHEVKYREEIRMIEDSCRKSLRNRYDEVFNIFFSLDEKLNGKIPIDDFVRQLVGMLPVGIEVKQVRRFARYLDKQQTGFIDYESFLDNYCITERRHAADRVERERVSNDDDVYPASATSRSKTLTKPSKLAAASSRVMADRISRRYT